MADKSPPCRAGDFDVVAARTQAWWVQLVAGQLDQAHPVHGQDLAVSLNEGVLTLKGALHSQADIDRLLTEAEEFKQHAISEVRSELQVATSSEVEGLLVQTLMAAFESPEQASYAASFVRDHLHVDVEALAVVEPDASIREMVPESFVAEAETAQSEGRTLLIVTLEEIVGFAARQLLEEETRSLWTIAFPPQPASKTGAV